MTQRIKYCGYPPPPCIDDNKISRSIKLANNFTLSLSHIDCVRSWCAEDFMKVSLMCELRLTALIDNELSSPIIANSMNTVQPVLALLKDMGLFIDSTLYFRRQVH